MSYNVKFTNKNKAALQVPDDTIITDKVDVSLLGRTKLEYGETLNANLLHILENFACPEDTGNPGNPDLNSVEYRPASENTYKLLEYPTAGQLWFNKTTSTMYSWDGVQWRPMSMGGSIAFNWGVLCDGQQIPQPVSDTGYTFPYSECVWIVSPESTSEEFESVLCETDENGVVTMQYGIVGGGTRIGNVTYMIVGIRGNTNLGTVTSLPPTPTPTSSPVAATPTPTPTTSAVPVSQPPTPTPTGTPGASPTPTPTVTGTPAVTPTVTPTVTPSVTPTQSVPALEQAPGSDMVANKFHFWSIPCAFPAPSATISANGNIVVSGGSGSFTYSWSRVADPASNFPSNFSSSGNTFTVSAGPYSCPHQGTSFGTVSVLVTDTVTGQQETFNGSYSLEYTG